MRAWHCPCLASGPIRLPPQAQVSGLVLLAGPASLPRPVGSTSPLAAQLRQSLTEIKRGWVASAWTWTLPPALPPGPSHSSFTLQPRGCVVAG